MKLKEDLIAPAVTGYILGKIVDETNLSSSLKLPLIALIQFGITKNRLASYNKKILDDMKVLYLAVQAIMRQDPNSDKFLTDVYALDEIITKYSNEIIPDMLSQRTYKENGFVLNLLESIKTLKQSITDLKIRLSLPDEEVEPLNEEVAFNEEPLDEEVPQAPFKPVALLKNLVPVKPNALVKQLVSVKHVAPVSAVMALSDVMASVEPVGRLKPVALLKNLVPVKPNALVKQLVSVKHVAPVSAVMASVEPVGRLKPVALVKQLISVKNVAPEDQIKPVESQVNPVVPVKHVVSTVSKSKSASIPSNESSDIDITICSNCNEEGKCVVCTDCADGKPRCGDCFEFAHKRKPTKHQTTHWSSENSPLMCRNHPQKECEFYCHSCKKVVCALCIHSATHHGHKCTPVIDEIESTKHEINVKCCELEERTKPAQALGRQVDAVYRELMGVSSLTTGVGKDKIVGCNSDGAVVQEGTFNTTIRSIRTQFQKFHDDLKRREDTLVEKANAHKQEKVDALENQMDGISLVVSKSNSVSSMTQHNLKTKGSQWILENKASLLENIEKNILQTQTVLTPLAASSYIAFQVNQSSVMQSPLSIDHL